MLNPSTYIASYTSTDKTVVIVDTNTNVLVSFNICAIVNATTISKDLVLHFTDGFKYTLNFASSQDAITALITWNLAMDTLCPNCLIANTSAPTPTSVTQITKTAYDILWNAGTVVPYTPYEIIDTLDEFGEGTNLIYCFTPVKNDETFMDAKLKSDDVLYTLDFRSNIAYAKRKAAEFIVLDTRAALTTDGTSQYLKVTESSYLDSTNSFRITVTNKSLAAVVDCSDVTIENGSAVILNSATNVTVKNVQGDLSSYVLSNVTLDNNSIGKLTNEEIPDVATLTLNAYEKGVYQQIPITISQAMTITLDDPIALLINNGDKANSMFYFNVPATGLAFDIIVLDASATQIDLITNGEAGLTIQYKYNSTTDLFEKAAVFKTTSLSVNYTEVLPITTNGQTLFALTTTSTYPTLSTLFLNGVKQRYSVDYVITGGSVLTWLDTTTTLSTTDLIEIYYQ